jgi:hypothetical protein
MDDADRAASLQADLNRSAAARRRPESGLEPVGWCHACGEDLDGERLFCGPECADEWERNQQRERLQ